MNYIFFDTETNSGRLTADILTISAFFCDKNFKLIEEFHCEARLRKSRIYEIDSFLVNKLDPFDVDKFSNSNFDLTKKTNDKFISWINKGPVLFCAHNGYSFDYMLFSQHLFANLFTWPWIFSTGNAKQIDSLPIVQNFDFYSPNMIATELNAKSNKMFKLESLCKMNGFDMGKDSHTSKGDVIGMKSLMELLQSKNPDFYKKSLGFTNQKDVLSNIKEVDYFCHPETFFGRTRQFISSYICEHPIYKSYHLVADLKHDWEKIFSEKSDRVLDKLLNSAPKKIRQIKAKKNPLILDKSFITVSKKYNDDYSKLGDDLLKSRAEFIIKNRTEISERLCNMINYKHQDNNIDQTPLLPEQMIFSLNASSDQKALMNNYVLSKTIEEKRKIHKEFKGPIKHLSEMALLDKYDREAFSDSDYNRIRSNISRRLLSTNKEVFPTIPDAMERIDTLREENKNDKKKMQILENINAHLEGVTKDHEKYLK
tara:strand:- start:5429 stop:6877 length:1449 start_codon:yes stop_codon:yes gene_type:complete